MRGNVRSPSATGNFSWASLATGFLESGFEDPDLSTMNAGQQLRAAIAASHESFLEEEELRAVIAASCHRLPSSAVPSPPRARNAPDSPRLPRTGPPTLQGGVSAFVQAMDACSSAGWSNQPAITLAQRRVTTLNSLIKPSVDVRATELLVGDHVIDDCYGGLCTVKEIRQSKVGGMSGRPKVLLAYLNLATGHASEQIYHADWMVPKLNVTRNEYVLLGVDADGFVSLLSAEGEVRSDLRLPSEPKAGTELEGVVRSIRAASECDASGTVVVLEAFNGLSAIVNFAAEDSEQILASKGVDLTEVVKQGNEDTAKAPSLDPVPVPVPVPVPGCSAELPAKDERGEREEGFFASRLEDDEDWELISNDGEFILPIGRA